MIRKVFITAAFVACTCLIAGPAMAQFGPGNSPNVLFSQYSTAAGPSTATAGMYPAPYNTLQLGAQSYYTYQPLMPHEMMYQHNRNYYNYYNSGGYYPGCNDSLNITKVRWQSGTNHMGPMLFGIGGGKHRYRHQSRKYNLNQNCGGDCQTGGCQTGNCGAATTGGCASGNCATNVNNNGRVQR